MRAPGASVASVGDAWSLRSDLVRVLLQRVSEASVAVDGENVAVVGRGLLALVGVRHGDTTADAEWLAAKIAKLRVFADSEGKTNLAIGDVDGEVLAVSQFTLYGNVDKGNRPSFIGAAEPEIARSLFDHFAATLASHGVRVSTGRFGHYMHVRLLNDGPFTLVLDHPA